MSQNGSDKIRAKVGFLRLGVLGDYMKTLFTAEDGTEYIVREPKISDAKQWMIYYNKIIAERPPGLPTRRKKDLFKMKARLKKLLKRIKAKKEVYLFAEREKKIVAVSEMYHIPKDKESKHMRFFDLSVSEEERGKGLGSFLIKKSVSLVRKRMPGVKIIELIVFSNNKFAYRLYKKFGFKMVSEIPKRIKRGARYLDEIYMHYYL